jgi:ABC-2 family transporter protein
MNTTTLTVEPPSARRRLAWSPRLVSAEYLKLRKRRGLVISALALTVVPMLIAYAVILAQDGTAGGMENFTGSMSVLTLLSVVAAILVGATLGTGDTGAGVFRELVVTGCSRSALFAARVPAGLALLLPIVGVAFAITATAAIVFAGSLEVTGSGPVEHLGHAPAHGVIDYRAPSGILLAQSAGWLALVVALSFALALGISSLLGSRGTSIGILLGWWLVATPMLMNLESLGSAREGLAVVALDGLAPAALFEGDPTVPMSRAAGAGVLLAWAAVPLALGAWRTCTRDA